MSAWSLFLAARGTRAFLLTVAVTLVAVLAAGVRVFEVVIDPVRPPRFTPVWEALPVAAALLAPALVAPRLASWEILAGCRVRWRAAVLPVAGALAPAAIPWVAHFRLPADARWWDICCNVGCFGALAFLATPWLGRAGGPIVGLGVYVAVIAAQQLDDGISARLPVSGAASNLQAHPVASALLIGLAALAWGATNGRSRFLARLQRNT